MEPPPVAGDREAEGEEKRKNSIQSKLAQVHTGHGQVMTQVLIESANEFGHPIRFPDHLCRLFVYVYFGRAHALIISSTCIIKVTLRGWQPASLSLSTSKAGRLCGRGRFHHTSLKMCWSSSRLMVGYSILSVGCLPTLEELLSQMMHKQHISAVAKVVQKSLWALLCSVACDAGITPDEEATINFSALYVQA